MAKQKVFLYKKGCTPRIFVNPNEETLSSLKKEGIVLINPNEGSVHGLPLHHTYPDLKNNLLRPIPVRYRKDIKDLHNPIKKVKKEQEIKEERSQKIYTHLTSILYTSLGVSATLLILRYKEELIELLKNTGF